MMQVEALSEGEGGATAALDQRFIIRSRVLCVDFDETFTMVDSLHECVVAVLRARPWIIFLLPFWILGGRETLKRRLAELAGADLRSDLFPRRPETLALIAAAKAQGRRVELVSAAHQDLLDRACGNAGFDGIFGTSDGVNLKGMRKAKFLLERHPDGFAYVGDSRADIPVWQVASERFAVGISASTRRRIRATGLDVQEIAPRATTGPALLRAMRPHQWAKNLLIFVTLGLALDNVTPVVLMKFIAAFVAFCAVTSGTYLINDLTDIVADRLHPRKRNRPLASGALSVAIAVPAAVILVAAGLTLSLVTSLNIGITLLAYFGLTLAYSLGLKRLAIVDVLVVAILFTTRIIAGAFAYETPISEWVLIFSLFFFTSLAFMKRVVEIGALDPKSVAIAGRGYRLRDEPFLLTTGIAFGVAALVIFSLYVSDVSRSAFSQYRGPEILWVGLGLLGYWIMHMWLRASRREMHDDPILFALRDPVSLGLGATVFLIAVLAQIL
ncbi:MAG TPA: UbiA family prenyltransferase [Alphaproteobacteria bacterium]|nr:UbiA family prenyltransferase [Alphaproteobacteria bacterium]